MTNFFDDVGKVVGDAFESYIGWFVAQLMLDAFFPQIALLINIGFIIFTFIGLLGLRSFATTKKLANRSLIVIASICGPLLLAFGFFEIVVRIKA